MTSGIILAGGRSQRMGRDKALLVLDGRTLIQRVVDALGTLCDELVIATNMPDRYANLGLKMVPDVFPDAGSLGGLYAGLSAASQEPAVAVACDMPFLNAGLLCYLVDLAADADAVVPDLSQTTSATPASTDPRPMAKYLDLHPLHAVYGRACLAAIEAQVKANDLRMIGFLGRVRTRYVRREEVLRFDPQLISFFNVNTPDEWKLAEQIAQSARDDRPAA